MVCGDDGCGGTCDPGCLPGEVCAADGTACLAANDTCETAEPVGPVPALFLADNTQASDDYAAAACTGGITGVSQPDVAFSYTPESSGLYHITMPSYVNGTGPSLVAVTMDCTDLGTACLGYNDFFGSSSTNPETLTVDLAAGTTYYIIVDSYSPGEVGSNELLIESDCTPDCTGRICGDDGCGGTCDPGCGPDETCAPDGTACEGAAASGDMCADPYVVDTLPFTGTGNTSDASNDYGFAAGDCPGVSGSRGAGSNDQAWSFVPPLDGDYLIQVPAATYDTALYLVTDCGDPTGACEGASDAIGLGSESLAVSLTAGATYYIIVDGWSNASNVAGSYTLTVE